MQLMKNGLSEKMKVKSLPPVAGDGDMPDPDIYVVTSGGMRIPAHSKILASASPVLENMIERPQKHRITSRKIQILGVPYNAVYAFLQFLYSSECTDEQMEKYGIHLLALSHVYSVQQLKQRCTRGLSKRLSLDGVVDLLQLSRLCDAPDLYLRCMKMLSENFNSVEETDGWKFLQNNDPHLELEILQFIEESESREKERKRRKEEQSLYVQLSEAMECLEHICWEGCSLVGPADGKRRPCSKFSSTCGGLQVLMKHFGTCRKRVNGGGCSRCKRMWQLFRLHSSICHRTDDCRVPLCRQFTLKMQQERKGNDARWRLLVRKVVSAKVMKSLSVRKRINDVPVEMVLDHQGREAC